MLDGDYGDPRVRAEAAWALGKHRKPPGDARRGADAGAARTGAVGAGQRRRRAGIASASAPAELMRAGRRSRRRGARQRGAGAGAHAQSARRLERLAERDDRSSRARRRQAGARDRPAAPSPAADWIALDVVDFDGAPLGDAGYRLVLPDGAAACGRHRRARRRSVKNRSRPAPARSAPRRSRSRHVRFSGQWASPRSSCR